MTDEQKKKPTAGFWITVALIGLPVYALSSGPMKSVMFRRTEYRTPSGGKPSVAYAGGTASVAYLEEWGVLWPKVYGPLIWAYQNGPKPVSGALGRYLELWGMP